MEARDQREFSISQACTFSCPTTLSFLREKVTTSRKQIASPPRSLWFSLSYPSSLHTLLCDHLPRRKARLSSRNSRIISCVDVLLPATCYRGIHRAKTLSILLTEQTNRTAFVSPKTESFMYPNRQCVSASP